MSSKYEEPEDIRPSSGLPRKKSTKKWCKGKVGREHVFEWGPHCTYTLHYSILRCLNCGKIKDYHFGDKPG